MDWSSNEPVRTILILLLFVQTFDSVTLIFKVHIKSNFLKASYSFIQISCLIKYSLESDTWNIAKHAKAVSKITRSTILYGEWQILYHSCIEKD